jgi:Biogenesis of lysosome-related organelles complex-1 subunit 2
MKHVQSDIVKWVTQPTNWWTQCKVFNKVVCSFFQVLKLFASMYCTDSFSVDIKLAPYIAQIDAMDRGVSELEQVVSELDAYTSRLEAKLDTVAKQLQQAQLEQRRLNN